MFAAVPLLALPVLLYNLIVLFALPGGVRSAAAGGRLGEPVFAVPMTSGTPWPVSLSDVIVFFSLIILFMELLKSTTSQKVAIINHSLSMILFIGCLIEFLLGRAFATTAFFLLTTMVLLDVLAGFIVTIVAPARGAS